jgi:hypothetical protein
MNRGPLVLVAALVGLLLFGAPAMATPYPPIAAEPTVAVSATVVTAGGTIVVTGGGWQPGSQVTISLIGAGGASVALGTVTVAADGTFSARVTIPARLAPGRYTLRVAGVGADGQPRTEDVTITVAATAAAPAPGLPAPEAPTPAPGRLATTGGQLTTGGALAALFLVVGGGALFASRRLRKTVV